MQYKHLIFVSLFFLIILIPQKNALSLGYQIQKLLRLNFTNTLYDFNTGFKSSTQYPYTYQNYTDIAKNLVQLNDLLQKQNISLYTIIGETPQVYINDKTIFGFSDQQANYIHKLYNKEYTQLLSIYSNNIIFPSDIIKSHPQEFQSLAERRWIRQDGHWSSKLAVISFRELLKLMNTQHIISNYEFREYTDMFSTEIVPFFTNNNTLSLLINPDDPTNNLDPSLQLLSESDKNLYLNSQNTGYALFYNFHQNAIDKKRVLWLGDSFSLMILPWLMSHFQENYYIRLNRIDANNFHIKQFIIDKKIDAVVLQLSIGTYASYSSITKSLVKNLEQ